MPCGGNSVGPFDWRNSMELIIAEKPSVGRTIAAVLGVTETKDGYMQGKGMIVT